MRIVGSVSRSFNPAERNYDIHDRELLAIIHGLRAWCHLFLSSPHVITILINHKNLTYYRHVQRITRRVARYLGELAEYNFVLQHKPGAQNQADGFSRRPDLETGERDNENVLVLPARLFVQATDLLSIEEEVREAQERNSGQIERWQSEFAMDTMGGSEYYQGKLLVPEDGDLRRRVLEQYHDHQLAGHPGITNTIRGVMRDFWWPDIRKLTEAYVRGCAVCQSTKPMTTRPTPPAFPIISEEKCSPIQTISLDLITDLPLSKGYDSILTVVDQGCSKATIFLPCSKNIDALGIARLYTERIFPFFRIPQSVTDDRNCVC
jgi:predicted phosphohydrolase